MDSHGTARNGRPPYRTRRAAGSRLRRPGGLAVALVALSLVGACGKPGELDMRHVEGTIQSQIEKSEHTKVSVTCPDHASEQAGHRFMCSETSGSETYPVEVTVTDGDGHFTWAVMFHL